MRHTFEPKIVSVLREGYSKTQFMSDLSAGVITGIVALPLAIAFGIASGVSPAQGLFTAVIAGFIISLLSGSRVQIGGPTGAFIVVVYGVVQQFGLEGLAAATILAGIMLVVMGFCRMGNIIKFIPYPVTVGFTSGIAVIIAVTQIRDFLGLNIECVPAGFRDKLIVYFQHLDSVNFYTLLVAVTALLVIRLSGIVSKKMPGSLMAIIVTTVIVQLFNLPVETIGSRFGAIPATLPGFSFPALSAAEWKAVVPAAFSIALLGAVESLLSAVVADGMIGGSHRSNMELVAQGIANITAPLFGGIPATGAIARTATNIKNGGRTPFAGIIHAVTLLLILFLFSKLAVLIPIASLAAILIVVAVNMSEYQVFFKLLKSPKSDVVVLLSTFLLTVLVGLTAAIQAGMVMAALLFMKRMEQVSGAWVISSEEEEEARDLTFTETRIPPLIPGLEVFEINGPFFFGASRKFCEVLKTVSSPPKVFILRMRHVPAMDATGLVALEEIVSRSKKVSSTLIISGVQPQPLLVMKKYGLYDQIGADYIIADFKASLEKAEELVAGA